MKARNVTTSKNFRYSKLLKRSHLPRLSDLEEHGALPGEEVVPHVEQRGRLLQDRVAEHVVDVGAQDEAAPVRVPGRERLQPLRHHCLMPEG